MAAFHFFMTGKVLTNADFLQDDVPAAREFIMYQISLARVARELEDGIEYVAPAPLLYTEEDQIVSATRKYIDKCELDAKPFKMHRSVD